MSTFSRRDFVKGTALVGAAGLAAGMAGCAPSQNTSLSSTSSDSPDAYLTADSLDKKWAFEIPPEPIDDSQIVQEYDCDVIVVGSGVSGLVCAAKASENLGDRLIMISAGTKPVSRGGSNHGINTKTLKQEGIDYTPESMRGFIKGQLAQNSYAVDEKKWYRWINTNEEAMNWVIDLMEGKGYKTTLEEGYTDPDGVFDMPYVSHGWIGENVDDASLSGETLLVNTFEAHIKENGGQIYYSTKAEQLVRDDDNTGRVSAVICTNPDGEYVKYNAAKAVVLATGDFSLDRDMMRKYCPHVEPVLNFNEPNYDAEGVFGGLMPGDGQKMGLWIGAAWQRIYPNAPMIQSCQGPEPPSICFMMSYSGLLLDNKGERFMSEDITKPFLAYRLLTQEHPGYYAIWSADYVNSQKLWWPGFLGGSAVETESAFVIAKEDPELQLSHWEDSVEAGMWQKADTLEELLQKIQHPDPEACLASIERYNGFCASGEDEDFHKDPSLMVPIGDGPYYGVNYTINPGNFLTVLGGLRTNEKLQVCDEDDMPIEGLYNIGTMVGDFYANMYTFLVTGQNLGATCITFGYDVAKDLSE